jgi:hypothetical protein
MNGMISNYNLLIVDICTINNRLNKEEHNT